MMNHVPDSRAALVAPARFEASNSRLSQASDAGWLGWGRDRLATVDDLVRDQVQRHPLPFLGGALILGVAIGWLIKKR